jgi:flagellar protein FlgJ
MAISPPSDIVLDVLNNADPSRLEVAQAQLKTGREVSEARRLASTDASFASAFKNVDDSHNIKHRLDGAQKKDVPETYRKFEAMVLQNFIKTMLPESDQIYGKGASGEIWKGMMAEKIAEEVAKGGGVGIAESLMEKDQTRIKDKQETSDANRSDRLHMATQLIGQKQLEALDKLLPGDFSGKKS